MFITGPDVVKTVTGEDVTYEELGGAMTPRHKSGVAHFAVEDEDECLDLAARLLASCPPTTWRTRPGAEPGRPPPRGAGPGRPGPRRPQPALRHPRGDRPRRRRRRLPGGPRRLRPEHRGRLRPRLDGRPVGIVANQPLYLAGRPRHRRLDQGRPLRPLLRRLQHPASSRFVDVPGFLPGTSQEYGGIIRHGAKLLYAYAEATVPKVTVITRKAYGGAYDVMGSKHLRRRRQLRLADGRDRRHGPAGRRQHRLPQGDREGRRPGGPPRRAGRPSTPSASPTPTSPPSAATSTRSSSPR